MALLVHRKQDEICYYFLMPYSTSCAREQSMGLILFKALADETRLRLANILFHYELSVNELARLLDMGQSRISRHLKILHEAGLARFRRDGLWVFYRAPDSGKEYDFLKSVMPFTRDMGILESDLAQAALIVEERASRTTQFFNAIADNWDDLNHGILNGFNLAAMVEAAIPAPCRTVVDLGCGTGEVLARIMGSSRMAIGVDGSARMLDLCRSRLAQRLERLSLRIGDLNHLPLADHEADFACLNLVLHHLALPDRIFPEIRRILAPGGRLFISDFIRHSDESMRFRYGDHWLGFNPAEVAATLEKQGFQVIASERQPVGNGLSLFMITANSTLATESPGNNDKTRTENDKTA